MIRFQTLIKKFDNKGEKTGWSYIEITKRDAHTLKPNYRVSFRVKGKIDNHSIEQIALLPMGDGSFILPVNASIRKATNKKAGDKVTVMLEADDRKPPLSRDFIKCLKDEPTALEFFQSLPKGHQKYFSNWIESAKTTPTKTKRITMAVIALSQRQGFGEMIRANKSRPS